MKLFVGGEVVEEFVGMRPLNVLEDAIKSKLG